MSTSLALGVVGAAIGAPFGMAAVGWMIGSTVGSLLDPQKTEGPRLDDRSVQVSSYGAPIPIIFGDWRCTGNVVWPANLQVDPHSDTQSAKGGPEQTTFSYTATFAVLLCKGPKEGIGRIWANKKLIVDASGNRDPCISGMRFMLGAEDQEADALMVARDGSAPAYRGYVLIVFEDLELTSSGFGNRPPLIEAEVFSSVTISGPATPRVVYLGASQPSGIATVDPETNWVWSVKPTFLGSTADISVISDVGEAVITTFSQASGGSSIVCGVAAVGGEVWVLVRPWTGDSHAAYILVFTSGAANPDGSAATLPAYSDAFYVSDGGIYAQSIAYEPTTGYVWITYALTNAAVMQVSVVDPLTRTTVYTSPATLVIGYPSDICVAYPYVAVLGKSGGANPNLLIYDAASFALLHTITVPAASSVAKAIDWNSTLGVFVVMRQTSKEFSIVDPVTGSFISGYTYAPSADADTSPPVSTTITQGVTYYAKGGKYIFGVSAGGSYGTTLYVVDPVSLQVEHTWTYETGDLLDSPLLQNYLDGAYILAFDASHVKRLYLGSTTTGGPVTLASIVSELSTTDPAGLDAGDIDVTQLTDLVDGYCVDRQMTRRAAIEPLQAAYFFDGVESDHVLKFVKRGQAPAVTVAKDDRAAREAGAEPGPDLSITRGSELEIPYRVDVAYMDQSREYQVGAQYEARITSNSNSPVSVSLPILLTASEAKAAAMVNLYLLWTARTKFTFSTGYAYAKYEPTDVVTLTTDEVTYIARITSRSDQGNGVIEWEAQLEDIAIYSQTGVAAASNFVPQTIADPGDTILELLDTSLLRDDDDNAGFYVAMGGTTAAWRGGQLFKSADGGSTYDPVLTITNESTIATAQDVLGDFTAGNIFDEGNSVTVVLRCGSALTSATETQVLNGSNTAVIGAAGRWEVINFKNVELIAADTYKLTGLLRGRRGTEWATGTHQAGDTFVLASVTAWQRPTVSTGEIGLARLYKAPALRTRLSAATAESFTDTAIGLKPYAPVSLTGVRDGSSNLTIGWSRRSRIGYGTLNATVPLGEDSESYSVDIMNGSTVVRTLPPVSTQSATYSAADQTTDFGSPQASVTARVYQVSATVGRGTKLEGTI